MGFDVPVDIVVLMRWKPPCCYAERLLASLGMSNAWIYRPHCAYALPASFSMLCTIFPRATANGSEAAVHRKPVKDRTRCKAACRDGYSRLVRVTRGRRYELQLLFVIRRLTDAGSTDR
jgi:hypothetical protein